MRFCYCSDLVSKTRHAHMTNITLGGHVIGPVNPRATDLANSVAVSLTDLRVGISLQPQVVALISNA